MNLYMIRRSPDRFITDAYSFAIVAAETGKAARHTHPDKGVLWHNSTWTKAGKDYGCDLWTDPTQVHARLLGTAAVGTLAGAICTSFN